MNHTISHTLTTHGCMDELTDDNLDRWMDGWMGTWIDGWIEDGIERNKFIPDNRRKSGKNIQKKFLFCDSYIQKLHPLWEHPKISYQAPYKVIKV